MEGWNSEADCFSRTPVRGNEGGWEKKRRGQRSVQVSMEDRSSQERNADTA